MKKTTAQGTDNRKSLIKKIQTSEHIVPIWLGVILFVVVGTLSFMLLYASRMSDGTGELVWDYTYVRQAGEAEDAAAQPYTGPAQGEKTPAGAYLHLTHTFEESGSDRILYIYADHAPMQIRLDGDVIYNNRFGKAEYVGNRYNAVVIPAGRAQTADIYMSRPFSGQISSYTGDVPPGADTHYSITPLLVLGAVLAAAGIVACIVPLFLLRRDRRYGRLCAVALVAVTAGLKIAVEQLSRSTYMLNAPFWCNLCRVMPFVFLCVLLFNLILTIGASRRLKVCICAALMLSLAMLAAGSAAVLRWGSIALCAVWAALILMLCHELSVKSGRRVEYAPACFVVAVFTFCVFVSVSVAGLLALTETVTATNIFVMIVYLIVLYFIDLRTISATDEDYSDMGECCSEWVGSFPSHVERIYSAASLSELAAAAVEEMCAIAGRAGRILSKAKTEEEPVRACAAVYFDGGFTQVYNRGLGEKCDFDRLAGYYSDTGKKFFVCDSFFDFIFCSDGRVSVILHFENVSERVAEFISGIGYIEYAIMNVAFQRFLSDMSEEQLLSCQQTSFSDAAGYETYDNANTAAHISNVVRFTGMLCEELGFDEEQRGVISSASALHDIGKFAIPRALMSKKGNLSEDERNMINMHTEYGYKLLSALPGRYMHAAACIALLHHSRYTDPAPAGIDEKYVQYAQIVSVADVYDALTSRRNYKEAWDADRVRDYMNGLSGTKFAPAVIEALNRRSEDFAALTEGK